MDKGMIFATLCLWVCTCAAAWGQENFTYGNRPIDLLPKSTEARSEDSRGWDEPEPPAHYELALHTKDLFRVGKEGLERLCVVEARRPEGPAEARPLLRLALVAGGNTLWQASADWIGTNQRMRPYWLPVRRDLRTTLALGMPQGVGASCEVKLGEGAPAGMLELSASPEIPAVDAGFALLPGSEMAVPRKARLRLRVGLARPLRRPLRLELHNAALSRPAAPLWTWEGPAEGEGACFGEVGFRLADLRGAGAFGPTVRLAIEAGSAGQTLARQEYTLHVVERAPQIEFGARTADLRFTAPIADGDRERTWDELWGQSDKRDVVVGFPGSAARLVFWRGGSYVPCWALPEAWLTYEWLEAEPYFFGADDCVEPLQDRDCKYSRAEIVSSTLARAVVVWRYALTDFQGKIIQDEHAEETFTIYPDGVGTRHLRGFYKSGWHENQEFIVVNRPGRRASQALDPQALTFHTTDGRKQTAVWPKPGFSLQGWPHVITLVNIGHGPRPFMVTLDGPQQVKVWAEPYLDKPDLFNSYPHWPVTRGMRTSWLSDPRGFERPTHSNLANLVNRPIRETETEKDFLWLIGVAERDEFAIASAASWLQPGSIRPRRGVRSGAYDQVQRAYVIEVEQKAERCELVLVPPTKGVITNPAFVLQGWEGKATVEARGAQEVLTGQEKAGLVVWVRGRFSNPVRLRISRGR